MLIAPIALRSWLIKQIYRILICIYLLLPHFKCTLCDENCGILKLAGEIH